MVLGIHYWGLKGVCFVWLFALPVLVAGFIHLSRHVSGITVGELVAVHTPILIAVAAMIVAVTTTKSVTPADSPTGVLVVAEIVVGALTYIGTAFYFGKDTLFQSVRELIHEIRKPVQSLAT